MNKLLAILAILRGFGVSYRLTDDGEGFESIRGVDSLVILETQENYER